MSTQSGNYTANRRIEEARRLGLTRLSLRGLRLSRLPESLGELKRLVELTLSNNQLAGSLDRLEGLKKLRVLDLSSNGLSELPRAVEKLKCLEHLALHNNNITALPGWLAEFSSLRSLDLHANQVSELPPWLFQLINLEELYFDANRIGVVPEGIASLRKLRTLNLDGNRLQALPDCKLVSLTKLWVENNDLKSLPGWLNEARLNSLDVRGNDALNIPSEIAAKWNTSPREIVDYYFSVQDDRGSALRELKLLVVGRGGAGKTSLVKRLHGEPLDPKEGETHGINISPLELDCHDGGVTARLWDFGGQHVLHAMHEFFLTARSLYLLVLGEREDMAERDAAYWLQLIRGYAGDAPVVVAMNKSLGRSREMDRESLERNFGPILAWVSTECSDGFDSTIEDLRTALTEAADRMDEVRNLFPKKWWEVKEWLEGMDEPYLDFETYKARCSELGESDGAQQERLASWLNDLGIAINYAQDERLHDTTVLRPDWLANGIYAILRSNDSHHEAPLAPDATLAVEKLGAIYAGAERLKMLRAADYPEEKWPFLLQLMKLFQLAFPIDAAGSTLLVPTLLPLEPPPHSEESEDADRTRLRYEFAVVPGPLLPKLLVRLFSLIDGEKRWRRGAILRYGEARARVWATQDERWVRATAVGNAEDRDELLVMIRVTLEELFDEYQDLRVVEQWEHNGKWVPRETLEEFGVLPTEDERGERL